MPFKPTGSKKAAADSDFQRMSNKPKAKKKPLQHNAQDIYEKEGWEDDPSLEADHTELQKNYKKREHQIMMQYEENKKKKLGISKWDKKKK